MGAGSVRCRGTCVLSMLSVNTAQAQCSWSLLSRMGRVRLSIFFGCPSLRTSCFTSSPLPPFIRSQARVTERITCDISQFSTTD
ncbi:hypothetical protein ANANG_G00054460 [Anguilla anguilla]|uniref:Secreted protein n=1 Tax=Anguilla anguilla TaxID=7936 RepID=A0A9D3S1E2_ANGAN|nr:hypothetical protein ANANG_G00054460 [Anguilla anguilla]